MKKNHFFGKYYKFISDDSSFSFAMIIRTANERFGDCERTNTIEPV